MAFTATSWPSRGPHRRVEGVAGTEGLAAALAGPVARVERVGPARIGLDGPLVVVERRFPTAKLPDLVEADGLRCSCRPPSRAGPAPTSRSTFSADGPERRVAAIRASSRSTSPWSRSRKVSGSQLARAASASIASSERRVIGATAEPGDDGAQRAARVVGAMATSVESTPPKPMLNAFSTTTTRRAPASASRTALAGNGRNDVIPTTPIRSPASRRASTASLMVPSTEPRATTTVSASSVPVGAEQAPAARPKALGELRRERGDPLERLELAQVGEVADLLERLGPDHRPDRDRIVGVEHLAGLVGRQEGVDLVLGRARRRRSTAWVRMKPSMHTITGSDSSSARRKAWTWRSAASWLVSANSWIQPASRTAMASLWSFQMLIGPRWPGWPAS